MDDRESHRPPTRSGAGVWLVFSVLAVAVGVMGAVAYKHFRPGAAIAPEDERVSGFLSLGHQKLAAGELEEAEALFLKASGLDDRDPRPDEGTAQVEAARTELAFWRVLTATDDGTRLKAVDEVMGMASEGERALDAIAGKSPDAAVQARATALRRRLGVMRVHALVLAGRNDDARTAIAKLEGGGAHPLVALLRSEVDRVAGAEAVGAVVAPLPSAASPTIPAASVKTPVPMREDYELDHEPVAPHAQPGELEIPKIE